MSSTTASAAATTATVDRQTYWCHECDMSVSLLFPTTTSSSSPTTLLCPYCHSDFLEEMDSPLLHPNSNSNSTLSSLTSFLDPPFPILSPSQTLTTTTPTTDVDVADDATFQFPSATASDDNYLLDNPYLQRLIQHLTNSDSDDSSPSATTTTRCHSPASKAAVQAIPTIKITASLLELDPIILCAVCKDQFVIDVEVKQLPCKHMYHSDCILPWFLQHNSCPVCRFQLPTENDDSRDRRSRFDAARLGELMEDEDLFGFGSTLRHIARRHRLVFPVNQQSSGDSPTQVGEAEAGFVERANSVETVTSWPSWPVERGIGVGGRGDEDIAVSARLSEDSGGMMSEARVSGSVLANLSYVNAQFRVISSSGAVATDP
ncbi:hypothetical protein F0562_014559 [Nyssa sinensis]|uniref:RING-type E3 ubiquitin transferase n=1 Tax=Nyssa sinensis TaxID=561372 RepID=A0A5J4ZN43_9ASTE|nr:hypothetical protein F0562_014559 [Nyssa sinensis]